MVAPGNEESGADGEPVQPVATRAARQTATRSCWCVMVIEPTGEQDPRPPGRSRHNLRRTNGLSHGADDTVRSKPGAVVQKLPTACVF